MLPLQVFTALLSARSSLMAVSVPRAASRLTKGSVLFVSARVAVLG
jgi:hypothetical protein